MSHIATYARYSSHNQREASIEDQQRICNRFAEGAGLTVTRKYSDSAKTGKTDDRPEYLKLKKDIINGEIDVLIVDDLSRLSRKIDASTTIEEFKYYGTRVISVSDGIDSFDKSSGLLIGIRTTINSNLSSEMKQKIHRGQEGNAISGKTTGGRFYGYKPIPVYSDTKKDAYGLPVIEYGVLQINEEEAKVVRQIFEWAAEEVPIARIANKLNKLGISGPTGKGWTTSTISSSSAGLPYGILNNKLYIGVKIWNKRETARHPITGEQRTIARDESEWVTVDMPELRIISDELWNAVKKCQEKRKAKSKKKRAESHPNARTGRAPGYLFSSILKCGNCGSNMIMVDKNNYRCGDAHRRGEAFCANKQKISRKEVEKKLLSSIKSDLFHQDVVEVFMHEANKELRKRKEDLAPNIKKLKAELRTIGKTADNIIGFIGSQSSLTDSNLLGEKLQKLELDKLEVERKLSVEDSMISSIDRILPRAMDRYRDLVDNLPESMKEDLDILRTQVKGILDEKIVMTPQGDGKWEATYRGSFRGLLRLGGTSSVKISDDALKVPVYMALYSNSQIDMTVTVYWGGTRPLKGQKLNVDFLTYIKADTYKNTNDEDRTEVIFIRPKWAGRNGHTYY